MANASTFVDSRSSSSSVSTLFKFSKYCCIICSEVYIILLKLKLRKVVLVYRIIVHEPESSFMVYTM